MLTPEAILPVTTPLSEQERLPIGLPPNWHDMSLNEQAAILDNSGGLIRINTYVSAGLDVGARRLDRLGTADGGTPIHEPALHAQFDTPAVHAAAETGHTEHRHPDDFFQPTGNKGSGDRRQMLEVAHSITEHFGVEFVNPPLLFGAFGFNLSGRVSGGHKNAKPRSYENGLFYAIKAAEWDISLRGLAGLQHLHQGASRNMRSIVRPLHDGEPPTVLPDKASLYWSSRLAGTSAIHGVAYFLGYRAKSGPALEQAMRQQWGDADYSRKRDTFITALNLNTHMLSTTDSRALQNEIRKPVLQFIGNGEFEAAFTLLQTAAGKDRRPFSQVARKFLLGPRKDQTSEE